MNSVNSGCFAKSLIHSTQRSHAERQWTYARSKYKVWLLQIGHKRCLKRGAQSQGSQPQYAVCDTLTSHHATSCSMPKAASSACLVRPVLTTLLFERRNCRDAHSLSQVDPLSVQSWSLHLWSISLTKYQSHPVTRRVFQRRHFSIINVNYWKLRAIKQCLTFLKALLLLVIAYCN